MKPARNPTHTWPFVVGIQDLFLVGFSKTILWIHHRRFLAVFAQELLTASTVFAILDNIRAIAFRTVESYDFADHTSIIHHLEKATTKLWHFAVRWHYEHSPAR